MNATEEISRLEAALARARGERGHGATLRARGSVRSGTPPEQYVTLVLLQRERERERDQVPGGITSSTVLDEQSVLAG